MTWLRLDGEPMPPGLGRLSSLSSNHSTPDGTAPASQRHAVVFPVPTLLTSTKAPRQEEALKALRRPSASPAWKVEDSAALQLREELRGISRQLELGSRQDLVRTEAAPLPAHRRGWSFLPAQRELFGVDTSLG